MDGRPPVGLLLCLVVSQPWQAPFRGPPYSRLPMPLSLLFMSSFPIVVVAVIVVAILVSAIVLHGRPATCFHFTLACRLSARSACHSPPFFRPPSCCCHFVQFFALIFKYNPTAMPLLVLNLYLQLLALLLLVMVLYLNLCLCLYLYL